VILPTKYIPQDAALIGVGATLLSELDQPLTVSGLWDRVRGQPNVGTFERFTLASTLLYILGAIEFRDGLLARVQP